MALYGIKGNKCLQSIVERVWISNTSKLLSSSDNATNVLAVDYPEGFTKDNCIPIAVGGSRGSGSGQAMCFYGYGTTYNEHYIVRLNDSGIYVMRKADSSDKVEDDIGVYVYLMKWTD